MIDINKFYVHNESFIHKIDGSLKLLFILLWTTLAFSFNNIIVFTIMFMVGITLLFLTKVSKKVILFFYIGLSSFIIFNSILLLIISPTYGSQLVGEYTIALEIGNWQLTYENIWYIMTLSMKYICISPSVLLFILTTHPTKFAVSLNKLYVPYKISFAINLALRYIPSVASEFVIIKHAQEMKGVMFSIKIKPFKTVVNYLKVIVPLMKFSIRKVDVISDGMDLRGFGKNKKRTWIYNKKYGLLDLFMLIFLVIILIIIILSSIYFKREFYYPF